MYKFFLKCFFISTVLLLGIIVGIQMSSNNLVEMTGNEDYSIATLFNDEEVASNERDTSNYLTSHDLDAKQEKLEQIETFNLFSQLGLQLSELLNKVFSSILDKITGLVESALS